MDRHELFEQTAPCGLDCFNCELFEANLTEDQRSGFAAALGCSPADVACGGCRTQGGCKLMPGPCETRACVMERGLSFCSQCDDFPCARLMPSRDGADRYPHNIKLYNLCRIQAVGLQRWADEEARQVRERYYHGKFRPGCGPVL